MEGFQSPVVSHTQNTWEEEPITMEWVRRRLRVNSSDSSEVREVWALLQQTDARKPIENRIQELLDGFTLCGCCNCRRSRDKPDEWRALVPVVSPRRFRWRARESPPRSCNCRRLARVLCRMCEKVSEPQVVRDIGLLQQQSQVGVWG